MAATSTTPGSAPETAPGPARPAGPDGGRGAVPALLLRLHFYIGIFIGPFLLIAALSGAAYALSPQLEQILYAPALTGTASERPLSLDQQVAAAQAATGLEAPPAAVRPAEDGGTTRVMFADPQLGPSEHRGVFVDPGTGEVVGDMTVYGTSGSLPFRTGIDQLHRSLLLGEPGRLYSELAASWLWVAAVTGLGLWALRWRRTRRGRRVRGLLVPNPAAPTAQRRTLSWHAATGVWAAAGLLFLSATGLTWSTYAGANVTQLRAALGWQAPVVQTALTGTAGSDGGAEASDGRAAAGGEHAQHAAAGEHHHGPEAGAASSGASYDGVLAAARSVEIDAQKIEVAPGSSPEDAWTVSEIDRGWPTQVDTAAVDPSTGQVVDVVRFSDYGLMAKLARWGIDAHMGVLFGVVNQIVMAALALALAAMIVWGYLLWWRRRPTRGRHDPGARSAAGAPVLGRAPARGAVRRLPPAGILLLTAVTVAVGLLLPLLGLSLLGFLALDALLGLRARRTAPFRRADAARSPVS